MQDLTAALIVATFSFGGAIFYTLSCIERSVLRLGLNHQDQRVKEEDARFVHAALKRLIPLLPPSNGFVILFGTVAMVYQAGLRNWDWQSVVVMAFYWLFMGYLITLGNIAGAVRDVRETSSDADIDAVRCGVGRLVVRHHLGLVATLGTAVLELAFVIA